MNKVEQFVAKVQSRRRGGASLTNAVRSVLCRHDLATEILDQIGSWPSSEPELRELQKQ